MFIVLGTLPRQSFGMVNNKWCKIRSDTLSNQQSQWTGAQLRRVLQKSYSLTIEGDVTRRRWGATPPTGELLKQLLTVEFDIEILNGWNYAFWLYVRECYAFPNEPALEAHFILRIKNRTNICRLWTFIAHFKIK